MMKPWYVLYVMGGKEQKILSLLNKGEDIKAFTPKEKSLYEKGNRYTSAYKQYDKYFLFIERALNLLKPDGYLGYVVPNKFMKVGAAKELRNFIANNAYLKTMISFGAQYLQTSQPILAS